MSGLPDLIAVALRPLLMVAVGAVIYRIMKLVVSRQTAARTAFIVASALFLLDLFSIGYPALRIASVFATGLGIGALALILRKRAFNG